MRRDALFLTEMIDAAEQAIGLVAGRDVVHATAVDALPDLVERLRGVLAPDEGDRGESQPDGSEF